MWMDLALDSPRGVRLKCYYAFFLVCCGCDTSYKVSVPIQFQVSIYTLSLSRGHSWRVQLAKQETLTPPGHVVSPLVCRGPWMSTVVLNCWYHSDSASVLLCFTLDPADGRRQTALYGDPQWMPRVLYSTKKTKTEKNNNADKQLKTFKSRHCHSIR